MIGIFVWRAFPNPANPTLAEVTILRSLPWMLAGDDAAGYLMALATAWNGGKGYDAIVADVASSGVARQFFWPANYLAPKRRAPAPPVLPPPPLPPIDR